MPLKPISHFRATGRLANALKPEDIYNWLVTTGYYPEAYILPPCFTVLKHPAYGKRFFTPTARAFKPRLTEYHEVHFPKTDYTDRTFGVLDPELNSDIALTIAENWSDIAGSIFHASNKVCSYSFPIPLSSKSKGEIGTLRSGRMIYEFIEMAENDLAAIAHSYKFLIKTDIKNFYPSIYTHSIPWALHGKAFIRGGARRHDHSFAGNRLDKLFQSLNDGCTNGLPIGPAVSDLASELVASGVDRILSSDLPKGVVVVRFKDDYRILTQSEEEGITVIKLLQAALKEYRLELNDGKTQFHRLPAGLFREWVSQYHAANRNPKAPYDFRKFKEAYLSVIAIDRSLPGTGIIDRFLADIITEDYKPRIELDKRSLPKVLSLLMMLGGLRAKAFPKVLAVVESILGTEFGAKHSKDIASHLCNSLDRLAERETENRYLISWICYFIRANNLESHFCRPYTFHDPIASAVYSSRFSLFGGCKDFTVFEGVKKAAGRIKLLRHLDVFKPQ